MKKFDINSGGSDVPSTPERDILRQETINTAREAMGRSFIVVVEKKIPSSPGWSLIARSASDNLCILWKLDGGVAVTQIVSEDKIHISRQERVQHYIKNLILNTFRHFSR